MCFVFLVEICFRNRCANRAAKNISNMYKFIASVGIIAIFCILDVSSKKCLDCLCEASTGCDKTKLCAGDICGPFSITWSFWADAGKPTCKGESSESATAYVNCALDYECALNAMRAYTKRFKKDCNGDGKIDCDDYAAIVTLGGYGCEGELPAVYKERYETCKRS